MRATEAARNTSNLIEDIASKVKGGDVLVTTTNGVFQQVTTSSSKVVELMAEIAAASQEQAQGIEQVNRAVGEMNHVTQQNAASAEELAASMSIFKTNYSNVQSRGSSRTKRLPLLSSQEMAPEKLIPMDEDEF